MAVMLIVLVGCAEHTALHRENIASKRTNIFRVLISGETVPRGAAELFITASLKTHRSGAYSASDSHGTGDYKLLLNIDGQTLSLRGNPRKERRESTKLTDPEAGDGIRYTFGTRLRLDPGSHRILLALPADGIAVEREVTLIGGDSTRLVAKPLYSATPAKGRPMVYTDTSFYAGISNIELLLNGSPL